MKYTKEIIQEKFSKGEKLKYIFFWGHTHTDIITRTCLSQWYDCTFTVGGIEYHTAEQYMMERKAFLFKDYKTHGEIFLADNPGKYKALGRKISGFDSAVWDEHKTDIVIKGNAAKFSQNPELKNFLLNTGNRILVEASPKDRIWGIGMAESAPDAENPYCWKGENLLGFCLMEVRDIIRGDINDR